MTAMARKLACLFYRLINTASSTWTKAPNTTRNAIASSKYGQCYGRRTSLVYK
jgi:hypothetical protein